MLEKIISEPVLHTGAHVGYFSGVTALLPILSDAWEKSMRPWIVSPQGFVIAFGLILLSIILLGFVAGSISRLMRSMGWLMLIPGVLAIIFAAFGQAQVFAWAENSITGFATAEPVVHWLVEESVPSVAYLGGVYILIGVCLIWVGKRIEAVGQFV